MSLIALADFKKLDLRSARITAVEEIAGADRLWKLTLDVGSETKTIVAGIKNAYPQKESLIGKNIVVVNNLEPAVIRGVQSHGMLLAAKDAERLSILVTDQNLAPGSVVG